MSDVVQDMDGLSKEQVPLLTPRVFETMIVERSSFDHKGLKVEQIIYRTQPDKMRLAWVLFPLEKLHDERGRPAPIFHTEFVLNRSKEAVECVREAFEIYYGDCLEVEPLLVPRG